MMKKFKFFLLTFFLSFSLHGNEEGEADAGDGVESTTPTYVLVLNSTEKCGKTKDRQIDCEIALVHAKHLKKFMLFKFNPKNTDGRNQVNINMFLENPSRYSSYATDYTLASLFNGAESFSAINVQITTVKERKNILIRANDGSTWKTAYIDIQDYTN